MFGPRGIILNNLGRGPPDDAKFKISRPCGFREDIFHALHFKLCRTCDSLSRAIFGPRVIVDSFHIVSAHAPDSLVPRYLREITREGATFIRLPYITQWNMENDLKKNKFANKD